MPQQPMIPQRQAVTADSIRWVKFVDPRENAYTIDVPQGWRVQGGTSRHTPLDAAFVTEAISPDGSIRVRLNDPTIIGMVFIPPSPMNPWRGAKVPMGQDVVMTVMNYMTGQEFAAEYGQNMLRPVCPNPQVQSSSELQNPPSIVTVAGEILRSGQALVLCGDKLGYVFASTSFQQGLFPSWQVKALMTYVAPAARAREATAVVLHMGFSIQTNPQWMAAQLQRGGISLEEIRQEVDRLIQQHQHQEQLNASWHSHIDNTTQDEIGRIIRGVTLRHDTLTGQDVEVDVGPNGDYYWKDDKGNVVNTRSSLPPGPQYHLLRDPNQ